MSGSDTLKNKIESEMKDLAESINSIVSNFKKLQSPLTESHDKVPQATEQLDKISEQTEAATHQMLDTVEKLTEREQDMVKGLTQLKEQVQGGDSSDVAASIDKLITMANKSCNDGYAIMDALQFQDITSQQINHAAALLEEIEVKLKQIILALHGEEENSDSGEQVISDRQRVFDPHADLFDKKTNQQDIDDLIASNGKQ